MKVKSIKAESFDLMQFFYRSAHEPIIHAKICFDGHLDEAALKKAVTMSAYAAPLISCCFNADTLKPEWELHDFDGEDMVHIINAGPNDKSQAERLLCSSIDIAKEPQLKIFLVRTSESDTLCVLINHMVCDGAGFKEYLYLLSRLYTECLRGEPKRSSGGPRGIQQLFSGFTMNEKWRILRQSSDLSALKHPVIYRLQGDDNRPFIVTRQIDAEDFLRIKRTAKANQATINDMMLAAFARVLSKITGNNRISFPCPVDLRKYLQSGAVHGVCNLTSNYLCDIEINKEDSFYDTLIKVNDRMRKQKESLECLKPVFLLDFVFRLLPFPILKKIFGKLFTIPVLSYTNLGILDKGKLCFGVTPITDAFLTGAVKYSPYFQLNVSTFDGKLTMSCNLHGTPQDQKTIDNFLSEVHRELLNG